MPSARTVVIGVFLIAAISLIGVVLDLAAPPDSNGLGGDSYGTHLHGQRAFYELLGSMGMAADRAVVPPTAFLREGRGLLFLGPDPGLVALEPEHLRRVSDWVAQGGHALIAPAPPSEADEIGLYAGGEPLLAGGGTTALNEIGVKNLRVETMENLREEAARRRSHTTADKTPKHGKAEDAPRGGAKSRRFFALTDDRPDTRRLSVSGFGTLVPLANLSRHLLVPADDLQVIDTASTTPMLGGLFHRDDKGTTYLLAAVVPMGKGSVTVVSDPSLAENGYLDGEGNAVVLVHLVAAMGSTAVFDEFYHGLTIRGRPAWLLTRQPYGILAILVALVAGVWAWREAASLGPPLPERLKPRRNLREYVDAMAALFSRPRHRHFIGREILDGTVWALQKQLGLPHRPGGANEVIDAIHRRDPARAARFRAAVFAAEKTLNSRPRLTARELTDIARDLLQCL